MPEIDPMTTAEALSAFDKEMSDAGIPEGVIAELLTHAGRLLLSGECFLSVKASADV